MVVCLTTTFSLCVMSATTKLKNVIYEAEQKSWVVKLLTISVILGMWLLIGIGTSGSTEANGSQNVRHGMASWYSNASAKREGTCQVGKHGGCLTASGKELNDEAFTAASWDFDLGQQVRVCSRPRSRADSKTASCLTVQITDRGPARKLYNRGRILDLSPSAFQALAPLSQGLVDVTVELVR